METLGQVDRKEKETAERERGGDRLLTCLWWRSLGERPTTQKKEGAAV